MLWRAYQSWMQTRLCPWRFLLRAWEHLLCPLGVLSLPFRAPKAPFIQSPVCLAGQSEEARTGAYEPGACTASARQTYHRRVSGSFLSGLDHMSLTSRIRVTIGVSDPVPDAFTAPSEVHTTSLSTLSNVLAAQMLQFSSRLQSQ